MPFFKAELNQELMIIEGNNNNLKGENDNIINLENSKISSINNNISNPQLLSNNNVQSKFKGNKILGEDNDGYFYSVPLLNKTCILTKESLHNNQHESKPETIIKNYSEIEKFLEQLEKNNKNPSDVNNQVNQSNSLSLVENVEINHIDLNEKEKIKTRRGKAPSKQTLLPPNKIDNKNSKVNKPNKTIELSKNIKDFLLTFKEFDEEEKRKESNYQKKISYSQ